MFNQSISRKTIGFRKLNSRWEIKLLIQTDPKIDQFNIKHKATYDILYSKSINNLQFVLSQIISSETCRSWLFLMNLIWESGRQMKEFIIIRLESLNSVSKAEKRGEQTVFYLHHKYQRRHCCTNYIQVRREWSSLCWACPYRASEPIFFIYCYLGYPRAF